MIKLSTKFLPVILWCFVYSNGVCVDDSSKDFERGKVIYNYFLKKTEKQEGDKKEDSVSFCSKHKKQDCNLGFCSKFNLNDIKGLIEFEKKLEALRD